MATQRQRLYLDSNIIIYGIENNADFGTTVARIFHDIDNGHIEATTSALTIMEVLVKPLETGDKKVKRAFLRALAKASSLRVEPVSEEILIKAAELRATTRLKTPDAIHAVTSRITRCTYFVTHDRDLKAAKGIKVLTIQDIKDNLAAGKKNPYQLIKTP